MVCPEVIVVLATKPPPLIDTVQPEQVTAFVPPPLHVTVDKVFDVIAVLGGTPVWLVKLNADGDATSVVALNCGLAAVLPTVTFASVAVLLLAEVVCLTCNCCPVVKVQDAA